MKRKIRTPFFETGVKNYIYGDAVLDYAVKVEEAARRWKVEALFIAPYTDIREVRRLCPSLVILAPYMDVLEPGRGMAAVLPEAIKAAGADGVVINHAEKPVSLAQVFQTVARANQLDLLSFVCADTIAEAEALAHCKPDILNPEPTELIGSGQVSDFGYVRQVTEAIHRVDQEILVEQAAGITTAQQVYDFIMGGSQGAGAASGILKADDPELLLNQMMSAVARAGHDLHHSRPH